LQAVHFATHHCHAPLGIGESLASTSRNTQT
jgi:hypothetical protein